MAGLSWALSGCGDQTVPTGTRTPGAPLSSARPSAPVLGWSPSTNGRYDYGTFDAGEAVARVVTLTNTGGSASGALTITLSASTVFSIQSDGCTGTAVGSGKSCTVAVRYAQATPNQSDHAVLTASSPKPNAVNATLTLLAATRPPGHIYWSNSGTIGRANVDGSGVNQSFIAGAGIAPYAIAADNNYVYWVNQGHDASTIGRAKLDGTNVNPSFITGLTAGADEVSALAVDAGHIYWTKGLSSIGRANLDGTGVNQNFISGLASAVGSLAVDGTAIYWTSADVPNGPYIGRANLDGTSVQPQFGFLPSLAEIFAVVADGTYLYYLVDGSPFIGRANRDWTSVNSNLASLGNTCIVNLAIDDNHLYWSCNGGTDPSAISIGRSNRDGTGINNDFVPGVGPTTGVAVSSR